MKKPLLQPTPENTYRIVYVDSVRKDGEDCNFGMALLHSQQQQERGDIEGACNTRLKAFQHLLELIPDSTGIELEWSDQNNIDAILLINYSAIDHFLIGDFEMCAAMLEMLLDLDPEDHMEVSQRLAYAYVALEEFEAFDEVINDISDKHVDKEILALWSEFRRTGEIPEGEFRRFKRSFSVYYKEFIADSHEVDDAYLSGIESEQPPKEALARELWLQTEHLWQLFPGFIEGLKSKTLKAATK